MNGDYREDFRVWFEMFKNYCAVQNPKLEVPDNMVRHLFEAFRAGAQAATALTQKSCKMYMGEGLEGG